MEFLTNIESWHWWVAGVVFLILEMLAPGIFFLWLGVAAIIVGLLLWVLPMAWEIQLVAFAILSVGSLVLYRWYLGQHPIETDAPTLNRRGEQYVGEVYVLEEPIVNGFGKVKVGDSLWKVKGADSERGNRVRVVAVDGIILQVEAAE